jgi:hypothetical protein
MVAKSGAPLIDPPRSRGVGAAKRRWTRELQVEAPLLCLRWFPDVKPSCPSP